MRLAAALLLLAAPAAAQDAFFQTPSGNIQCYAGGDFVDCEVLESDVAPPLPRPLDCDLDWGSRFTVGDVGPGAMACHGDTLRGQGYPVIPYGSSIEVGAITCVSEEAGLQCLNRDGGGFALSRRGQRIF
jgi:hypothetical protein